MTEERPGVQRRARSVLPIVATFAVLIVVDLVRHGPFQLPYPYPETLLVASLIAVAAAGYSGGYRTGFVSGATVTLYGLRFYATPDPSFGTMLSLVLLGTLCLVMASVSGYLRARQDALVQELREANLALSAANDGLESFAFVVSHDLKEPVRAMNAYLAEADSSARDPDVRAAIGHAREASDKLATLLRCLLEVSRASRLDVDALRSIAILDIVRSDLCTPFYAEIYRERQARLETHAEDAPPVRATEAHLVQIMGNLLLNAAKHSDKDHPRVIVRVANARGATRTVEVVVEDDGPGFPDAVANELTGRGRGRPPLLRAGFGLLIVQRAIDRLGGELWIGRSAALGGAAVHFTLPAGKS